MLNEDSLIKFMHKEAQWEWPVPYKNHSTAQFIEN